MAPKNRSRFADHPPSASPSQDHEEESEEEQEESEEEEVEEQEQEQEESEEEEQVKTPQKTQKKSQHPQNPKHSSSPPSEEEEEEEEEGSDDDDDDEDDTKGSPTASDFAIKPIAKATKNPTKNQEQKVHSEESTKPTSKRALEVLKKDSPKKKSKLSQENGDETKRVAANSSGGGGANVGRVWSEDDVIAVLKGMIDYQNQKGADPHADMGAFHEYVKGKIRVDLRKSQLYEKVRSLKKKFFSQVEKAEKGQDPVFSRPHEYKTFELSKKIWGTNNANSSGVDENLKSNDGKAKKSSKVKSSEGKRKEDGKKKREVEEEEDKRKEDGKKKREVEEEEDDKKENGEKKREVEEEEDFDKMIVEKKAVKDEVVEADERDFSLKYPNLIGSYDVENLPESQRKFVKENINLIDSDKARELDENWKRLRMEEIELFYRRSKLMTEQTKLVMEELQKS